MGLRNKQYCILNKQYSKEEYETLVPQIIEKMITDGERGESFDPRIAPFGYNESLADEHFPRDKETALAEGYRRCDYEAPFPQIGESIVGSALPDSIQ